MKMSTYEVVVGNVGTVFSGDSYREAIRSYEDWGIQSQRGSGRAAGEDVALMEDGEPIKEYTAPDPDAEPTELGRDMS